MRHTLRLLILLGSLWLAPVWAAEPETAGPPAVSADTGGALVANGLLAQTMAAFRSWADGLSEQIQAVAGGVGDLRSIGYWWQTTLDTPEARGRAWRTSLVLGSMLAVALLVELLLHWLLLTPRRLVQQRAAASHARTSAREAQQEAELAAVTAPATLRTGDAAALRDATKEHLAVAAGMVSADPDEPAADAPPGHGAEQALHQRRRAVRHWSLLDRLPYALVHALLLLLPLPGFLGAMAVLTSWQENAARLHHLALPIITAYASVRIIMALAALLATPRGAGLRLLRLDQASARQVYRYALTLGALAAVGLALAELAFELGLGYNTRTLLAKLTSLVTHLALIVVVWRTRRAVVAAIRGDSGDPGLRSLLADIWPFAATAAIAAFWVVWTLSVANGFQRALQFLGVTAAVLTAGYLIWALAVGLLDRSFERAQPRVATLLNETDRYHNLSRHVLDWLVGIATVIVLLQAWGLQAFSWFATGTVGQRLASAALTIGIAVVLGLLAWEGLSWSLRRRIERWTSEGDLLRAARLRTLVPIIRTCVLVAIVLVVLMTALSELGVNVAPMLAGASILGVALGFGSQKLVQDFITGVFLLMENTMQVGDSVTAAGVSGVVEHLSIRTVRLRAGDGSVHVVPFSAVTTVTNANRGFGNAVIRVNVTADSDIATVASIMRGIGAEMRQDPVFSTQILGDIDIWGVDQVDGAMVTIAGQIRTTDKHKASVQREYNRRLLEAFRTRGINLANPRETILTNPTS